MIVKLDSLPVVAKAACSKKTAIIEKAELVCRWQSLQWQRPTTSGSPVAALSGGHRFGQRADSIMFGLVAAALHLNREARASRLPGNSQFTN